MAHQVIIVCGETGSGKTTQLPKIALLLGRGKLNYPPGKGKWIGHTQPRRIAASSVAKRIAEELKTPPGEVVGYKVRFQDKLGRNASIKLMTDGILLAETQNDPLLKAYDTLIIDEAHERSLNIDFLLGYLRQLLPKRPDLKVIITSATIDAQRFADYFAAPGVAGAKPSPAPVILVSGRLFPVEQRWRPFEESRDYGLNEAIADGVDELWQSPHSSGDILVFLPGEREIREAADHLSRHLAHQPLLRNAEVLPLFARLTQAEQERIFEVGHSGRRIVLATNVAETSLTVPGIRYVIDAGTARVKRYSFRNKVEQLLVEPVSQAAANQRAGRCGRVADGICIRLYDEADFLGRPRFTDPEILRSSLAAVILRMKALNLGAIEDFAFIEPPQRRAMVDGYQLLAELGAVDDAMQLTPIGNTLAKLPLDPRIGRMILEAKERSALQEVLIIASALSVQDVRDRPMDKQAQADQQHAKFDDDKSEFSGYLKLWKWLEGSRTAGGSRSQSKAGVEVGSRLTNRQHEGLLRENFINIRRVREWRDIHAQLHTVVVNEQGWPLNPKAATYEQLHLSMLCGLLGNIGCKSDEDDFYQGARGIRFYRHPGARLAKKPGRWIVAAEIVETTRLFGRGIANIEPQWIEQVAGHLLKKQLLDPHWEKKAAQVTALERATLYGLVVYTGRRVNFGRVDPVAARELFIREALVAGNWDSKLPFLTANQRMVTQVQDIEHKSRRQDVLVDEELIFAFYDQHVPAQICSGAGLESWFKDEVRHQPKLLQLTQAELMRHDAAGITGEAFPRMLRLGGVDCKALYLHEPGDSRDGLTVDVPLFALNQVGEERCEWLVPGMLKDKVQALIKTLHQRPRSRLVPLPETAAKITEFLLADPAHFGQGALTEAVLKWVKKATSLDVVLADFKLEMLPPHFFMNIRVVNAEGRQLGMGRNLGALKSELGTQARGAFQALAGLKSALAGLPQNTQKVPEKGHFSASNQAPDQQTPARAAIKSIAKNEPSNSSPALLVAANPAVQRYTAWTFGDMPELMEISSGGKGGQTVIGFPALIDLGDAVTIEVFDEPATASEKHRAGLRRLFSLQIKDALKYLEKNLPELNTMASSYMLVGRAPDSKNGGGTTDELRAQIIEVALERAFLAEPLPLDEIAFKKRLDEGRSRLTLIASEVARLASAILLEYAAAQRKITASKHTGEAALDASAQLQRLVPKNFLSKTAYAQLAHFPRYLKGIGLRLEKWREDPARDAARMAELRPQEQRYWQLVAKRKGVADARLDELRWLIEELRISFFAQSLRTPQPVSIKRLDKAWQLLTN